MAQNCVISPAERDEVFQPIVRQYENALHRLTLSLRLAHRSGATTEANAGVVGI
jgi:hypothetical protein